MEPIPPAREDVNETPKKSRQNKIEINLGTIKKNTITLEKSEEISPSLKNSQKSRSGLRNTENLIQIEEDGVDDIGDDFNKIIISSNNVITFNQDDDEPDSLGSEDESNEAEKSENQDAEMADE